MRLTVTLSCSALLLLLLCAAGCSTAERGGGTQPATSPAGPAQTAVGESGTAGKTAEDEGAALRKVSLDEAGAPPQQGAPAAGRKIIRNAELDVEADVPAEGLRKVASVVEARGGFVVTSESAQHGGEEGEKSYEVVTVVARVPAEQFDAALKEIRGAGRRVTAEKITGRDVTEEFIDVEARVRTQKALEAQFLEIMKQAGKVSDALEVQRELANVRTEIERVEGRLRFLQSQTSLSTLKVTLRPPSPLVGSSTAGFFHGLKRALGDGVDIAAAITLGLIRVAFALIPLALFVALPIWLLARYVRRRVKNRAPLT